MSELQAAKTGEQGRDTCTVIPLGGLGEIGKNMLALECGDQILVIDAGLCFPSEDQPGIDFIVPDITYLRERVERVQGIILTHGHEDHVGALPYILRQLPVPIYGTRMTLGMVKNKLEEHALLDSTELHEVKGGDTLTLGVFEITCIPVAHSIVDGIALGIRTPAGTIVHTGDFKLDPTPVDGRITDLGLFAEFGRRGVDLLLADSTNADREGYTLSEREVGVAFDEIVRDAPRRVLIACFSSNIHRFQQVINTAVRHGRKLGVLGMSMIKNMRTAQELGYLQIPDNLWLKWNDLMNLPPEKSIVLTTGSQGEARSALARIAVGENQDLKLQAMDTVIVSARTIPGNERRIGSMINHFFRLGCRVHYERVSEIHVSGHAAQEELKVLHNVVRPKHFIPVHGEARHLWHHAELAHALGLPRERILILENGDCAVLSRAGLKRSGKVIAGNVLVDGKGVGDVGHVVLRDRQHLAQDGMLIVVMGLDRRTGELVTGPDFTPRGIADEPETARLMEGAKLALREVLAEVSVEGIAEAPMLQDITRSAMKKYFKREIMRFPMIIPVIVEV
ncbi:MAG: ribonuclease J [Candidatus Firestonebacteria bacterium]|nr:ribonuclease J [Candidatus Firestonebacteria bacterium]